LSFLQIKKIFVMCHSYIGWVSRVMYIVCHVTLLSGSSMMVSFLKRKRLRLEKTLRSYNCLLKSSQYTTWVLPINKGFWI
jgi:hypothetical protein